jgi:hypothetical protein
MQTMACHPVRKRDELSSHYKIRRNLNFILLNGRSQSEEVTFCMIPTIQHSGGRKDGWLPWVGVMNSSGTILSDSVVVDTCHYVCWNPWDIYPTSRVSLMQTMNFE